jgi:hypothetical protein
MVVNRQAMKQPTQAAPRKQARTFTIAHLWRMTLWGMTAAGALLLAGLTTRSEPGLQRMAALFSEQRTSAEKIPAQPLGAPAETRRLAEAVRSLTVQNAQLESRLSAVEQNIEDITGSVAKQIQQVKKEAGNSWPASASPEPITSAMIASLNPIATPSAFGVPLPSPPQTSPAARSLGNAAGPAAGPMQYGIDVGSALSIEVLRARWLGIRSAHRRLFDGLTPTVVLRQIPRSNRVELHLVAGPLDSSEAAAQLCAQLIPYRLLCQPVAFDNSHIALQ